ncbi:MAG: NAD-dependent epimerase/dehydratase family protein [Alphaproteobacteria bacterium]|nr:NAD-dependent epimerase/dehydratase family protein [Alphaproteobacteria bacterium]
MRVATVFGGTGFIGRQIVRELAKKDIIVKVASRIPESAYFLKPCGAVGQVVPLRCDYRDAASIREAVKGSDYVVNCVGILHERGKKRTFQQAHIDVPAMIARACDSEKVVRFVHISALGCDTSNSKYAKSKLEGEKAVLTNFPSATILRPSVVFGPDDDFFNMFAELARFLPALPLIGGGKTKFQPIYVGDVADAAIKVLLKTGKSYAGKIYHLGGPDVVTFREIFELLFKYTGRRRSLVSLPFSVAKIEAFFLNMMPTPLLTPDQVESLKTDNIVAEGCLDIKMFEIKPKSLDLILPTYLERYRSGGRFGTKQAA